MKDKFVWSLISAVGIFCLGAGVTVIHGFHNLFMQQQLEHLAAGLTGNLFATGITVCMACFVAFTLCFLSKSQPYPMISLIEVTAPQLGLSWLAQSHTINFLSPHSTAGSVGVKPFTQETDRLR